MFLLTAVKKNQNSFNTKRIITRFLLCLILLFLSSGAFNKAGAAQLLFSPPEPTVAPGSFAKIELFLLPENYESINALSISVEYPEDMIKLSDWSDGNSVVNLWIKEPKNSNGVFSLEGMIPGGYNGEKGLLVTMYFEGIKEGVAPIKIKSESKLLINDGNGSEAKISFSPAQILVEDSSLVTGNKSKYSENIPPEPFIPYVSKLDEIYGGNYFLVFATQDKDSGIDHYEVSEGSDSYKAAQSPYLLKNQNLDRDIKIKAVDKSGNERVEIIPAKTQNLAEKNKKSILNFSITLLFIVVVVILNRIYNKYRKRT